jgi:serine/threonine protein kinase
MPVALRAPEIIFSQAVGTGLDIWSFGCLVFELLTGRVLFGIYSWGPTDQQEIDDDHLLQMTNILGPLPEHLYNLWTSSSKYFRADRTQYNSYLEDLSKLPEGTDLLDGKYEPLAEYFESLKPEGMTDGEAERLVALLRRILQYQPEQRPTASDILNDPWFASTE